MLTLIIWIISFIIGGIVASLMFYLAAQIIGFLGDWLGTFK